MSRLSALAGWGRAGSARGAYVERKSMRATLGSCSTGWSSTSSTVTRDWCWDARPPVKAIACAPTLHEHQHESESACIQLPIS